MKMKITENAMVGLTYELKVSKDADDIESAPFSVEIRDEEDPFYFIFGQSGLPEKFEELLIEKSEGDQFSFIIKVEDAYGTASEELLITLPKSQFSKEQGFSKEMLKEGNFLPLMDENGYPMQAKVIKDLGEDLLLDFNHPLVDFDLHFEGSVLEVREATEDELSQGNLMTEHDDDEAED